MKKRTGLILSFVVVTLIITIGISYAYFTAQFTGGEDITTITVTGGTMNIVYNGGDDINLANIIPSDNPEIKTFTVTGNNTTDIDMNYKISFVVEYNDFSEDALKYRLTSTNTDNNGEVAPSILDLTNIGSGAKIIELGIGFFDVPTGGNKVHTYNLEIYFPNTTYNQNEDQDKEFRSYVRIENYQDPCSSGNCLKDKILGKNNENVTIPLTEPGKQVSLSNETVLASSEDDYGTSYYFRGAIKNNFIMFADMCWRIVRITGDGSIKLALYNYNKGANSCSGIGNSYAFARYNEATYKSYFNELENSNAYIGFMYGTAGSENYENEHTNNNKSTILNNLETWYLNNLVSYENHLADTIWCNDKSVDTKYPYGTILGYGSNRTGYSASGRIYANGLQATNATPTLICPNDSNGGKLSSFTVDDINYGNGDLTYKIGLLTADEIVYAGGMFAVENSTFYINENTKDTSWWTLSPYYYTSSNIAFVFLMSPTSGFLNRNLGVKFNLGLRPAISLISTTQVSGEGTSTNPYQVEV